jgi:formamidase
VVIGLAQLRLPKIARKSDLGAQTKRICAMVQKARKNLSGHGVFPEYLLHGLGH